MDYEKNKTIAIMKQMVADGKITQADAEKYCPEMAESEDEKTKRILHSISNKMSQHLRDIFSEEEFQCFDAWSNAWLEKCGEQKPAELPKVKSVPMSFKEKLGIFMQYTSVDLEKEENKQLLNEAAKELLQLAYSDKANEIALASAKTWEESMAILIAANNAYRRGQKEQKPAEWSDEDEKVLDNIFYILNQLKDTTPYKEDKTAKECIDKLKSLKERYTWKPSEEQITVLHDVAAYIDNSIYPNQKDILVNLYQQLKKL